MKKLRFFIILILFIGCIRAAASAAGSDAYYDENKAVQFQEFISSLKQEKIIPDADGEFYSLEDYEHSYGEKYKYEWNEIGDFENFVISLEMYWTATASEPAYRDCGCGLVFRENAPSDFMMSSLRMDGQAYLWGVANGKRQGEETTKFGTQSTEGDHEYAFVVSGSDAYLYVDGEQLTRYEQLEVTEKGNLGFAVFSGAQEDYGMHCEFWDIFLYTW